MCPGCEELFYSLEKMPYELLCGVDEHGTIKCQECWSKEIQQTDKGSYVECKLPHPSFVPTQTRNDTQEKTLWTSFKTASGRSNAPTVTGSKGPKIIQLAGSKFDKNFFDLNFPFFKARYDLFEMCRKEISYNFQQDEDETPSHQILVVPEVSEFEKNCTILPCGHKIQKIELRAFFNRPFFPYVHGEPKPQIEVVCPNKRCQQLFIYPKFEGDSEDAFAIKNFPNPRKIAAQKHVQFQTTHYLLKEEVLLLNAENFRSADHMLSVTDCVVCTNCFYELNQMHEIFGVPNLHVCYECLCLRCVQTDPPMDFTEFERSQKISFLGKVERATFTIPGFQNSIKLQYLVVPSYPNEPFSHLHFLNFIGKQYRNKFAIVEDLNMNKQFQQLYEHEMRNAFLSNVHKYLTCAVCEQQDINVLKVGYKLKSSFRSYVCGKCVQEKKQEMIKEIRRNSEKYKITRQIVLKFESARDGIYSFFIGKIHFNYGEEPYIYYQMEEAKELIGHLDLPRKLSVSLPPQEEIECFQCLRHFDKLARAPKIICPNRHCICFECLCALVFGFYQQKGYSNIICGVCAEEGPEVTFEKVGSDKINLQNLFETNEEIVELVQKWNEGMKK